MSLPRTSRHGKPETKAQQDKTPPQAAKANPAEIPVALKGTPKWVVWKYVHREGQKKPWTKPPFDPRTGQLAKSNDPSGWTDFETAWRSYQASEEYAGIGFVVTKDTGLVGFDFDNCLDENGRLSPEVERAVRTLNTYTEVSPSGTGLRAFAFGRLPDGRRKVGNMEVYMEGRYLTITGRRWEGTPATIEPRQEEIEAVFRELFTPEERPAPTAPPAQRPAPASGLDIDDRMRRAQSSRKGAEIRALIAGDWQSGGYPSQSEADQALANHLAYWLDRDAGAMDAAFRRSGLYRPKWDQKRGKDTYGAMTIQKAIAGTSRTFGGDIAARREHQNQTIPPRTGQDDHATGRNVSMTTTTADTCQAAEKAKQPEEPETCDDWREFSEADIIAFNGTKAPPIPPEAVPDFPREFCLALAEDIQVPFELPLFGALGALSIACQGKFELFIKKGYVETVNLYLMCALDPGERKSAVLSVIKKPLSAWEWARKAETEDERKQAESMAKSLQKKAELLRGEAVKETDEKLQAELFQKVAEIEASIPIPPPIPRLTADDVTMERFAEMAYEQGERIGVLEPEGGLLDTIAGRYQNGVPNLEFPLKGKSADPVTIDRKGKPSIHMNAPLITFCFCPQPAVMKSMKDKPMFKERGLVGRFQYCLPKSRVGCRRLDSPPTPHHLMSQYETVLDRLLSFECPVTEEGKPRANILTLTPEAQKLWMKFANDVEREMKPGGEFEFMRDWATRLAGDSARIAALFHIAQNSENPMEPIEADIMGKALRLASVLAEHAKVAYDRMGCNQTMELAKDILEWIESDGAKFERKAGVRFFRSNEAWKRFKGRAGVENSEVIKEALEVLVERGFIKVIPEIHKKKGRPPSPAYACAPGIFLKNK